MIKLLIKETSDDVVRENFRRIQKEFTGDQVILKGQWKFVELTFTQAVTNYKIPHGFSFVPKDIIQTSTTGAGFIQWNYDLFDRTNLDVNTSNSCVIRAFVGRYVEGAESL